MRLGTLAELKVQALPGQRLEENQGWEASTRKPTPGSGREIRITLRG